MAASTHPTTQFTSAEFVESAGIILFDFRGTKIDPFKSANQQTDQTASIAAHPKVVFFYSGPRKATLLPKGRRNISEPREQAALRETYEETGLRCRLLPVTLHSRATSVDPASDRVNKDGFTLNEVRTFHDTSDPFMFTMREYKGQGLKFIWWYVGIVADEQDESPPALDPGCELVSASVTEAVERLTFENDRELVRKAIAVMQETLGVTWI